VSNCPDNTYQNSTNQCSSTCPSGTYADPNSNSCVSNCLSSGLYGDGVNNICILVCPATYKRNIAGFCVNNCNPLLSDNITGNCVSTCSTGYWGYNYQCLSACPNGFYTLISDRNCYSNTTIITSGYYADTIS
jgi:hypothetical protein